MGRCVNKVTLLGNMGNDPDVQVTPGGETVVHFSLATNFVVRKKGEPDKESTDWHRITTFGKLAEFCRDYLVKGRRIYLEGRISYGSYERDGVTIPTCDIIAREIIALDGGVGPRTAVDTDPGNERFPD